MASPTARTRPRNPEPETVFLVVAYDISDDRRRARMHALLLGYGIPVQESVFECELRPAQLTRLKARVRRLARPGTDRIAFYTLCPRCHATAEDLDGPRPDLPLAIVV
ncbi:MAG: CRISPR-associated endoribonuclease Cas2 1 [Thermomicrobiales bacterium]|nr:MAG: CRISPR-associated endoribonuclease Cas2 1 [Thermomicrobiales bacterium]